MKNSVCIILSDREQRKVSHLPVHPIEWQYIYEENIGGDYAKATIVVDHKFVSQAYCACGQLLYLNHKGDIKLPEGGKNA